MVDCDDVRMYLETVVSGVRRFNVSALVAGAMVSNHWDRVREGVTRQPGTTLGLQLQGATTSIEIDLRAAGVTTFTAVDSRAVRDLAAQCRELQKTVEELRKRARPDSTEDTGTDAIRLKRLYARYLDVNPDNPSSCTQTASDQNSTCMYSHRDKAWNSGDSNSRYPVTSGS